MSIGPYKVVPGSQSGHCCFDSTVVDTRKPVLLAGGSQYNNEFEAICECFNTEDAQRVAAALNIAEAFTKGAL